MRVAVAAFVLAAVSLAAVGAVRTQKSGPLPLPATTGSASRMPAVVSPAPAATPPAEQAAAPEPAPVRTAQTPPAPTAAALPTAPAPAHTCANPNALGISRTVEIDTTGGPGFGFEHFKELDFLRPNEVVLTFDDGPWPGNTPAVLAALASHCIKATFFPIGKHAMWHPEILREVAAQGHTIGSHTWSHADLSKKTPEEAKDEIEKG
ncbi:MAG TPA: polysaccharide deacetylase family protein, partial [Xanthobacteraceae bacterium]|nr:polysaccharide deacetylase family protein [Xanthobacteraceae bacterium]